MDQCFPLCESASPCRSNNAEAAHGSDQSPRKTYIYIHSPWRATERTRWWRLEGHVAHALIDLIDTCTWGRGSHEATSNWRWWSLIWWRGLESSAWGRTTRRRSKTSTRRRRRRSELTRRRRSKAHGQRCTMSNTFLGKGLSLINAQPRMTLAPVPRARWIPGSSVRSVRARRKILKVRQPDMAKVFATMRCRSLAFVRDHESTKSGSGENSQSPRVSCLPLWKGSPSPLNYPCRQ